MRYSLPSSSLEIGNAACHARSQRCGTHAPTLEGADFARNGKASMAEDTAFMVWTANSMNAPHLGPHAIGSEDSASFYCSFLFLTPSLHGSLANHRFFKSLLIQGFSTSHRSGYTIVAIQSNTCWAAKSPTPTASPNATLLRCRSLSFS